MPTLTASAPASMSASVASAVAMLPATMLDLEVHAHLIRATCRCTPRRWPWAVSMHDDVDSRLDQRLHPLEGVGADADGRADAEPARGRPWWRAGSSIRFWMSLTVMSPWSVPSASTTGSFSMRWRCEEHLAPPGERCADRGRDSPLAVITRGTGCRGSFSKRRSRLVRIPTSRPLSSVTGTPEMWYCAIKLIGVGDGAVGPTGDGFDDHPGLGALHPFHLGRLVGDGEVAVDDADAALAGQGDGDAATRSRCPWRPRRAGWRARFAGQPGLG